MYKFVDFCSLYLTIVLIYYALAYKNGNIMLIVKKNCTTFALIVHWINRLRNTV